jgi:hypothetical protein
MGFIERESAAFSCRFSNHSWDFIDELGILRCGHALPLKYHRGNLLCAKSSFSANRDSQSQNLLAPKVAVTLHYESDFLVK